MNSSADLTALPHRDQRALTIAFVLPSMEIGGMEHVVLSLAAEMQRRGHRCHVICTQRRGPLADDLAAAGIVVHECFFRRFADNLGSTRLTYLLRNIAPDIVHSHTGVWLGAMTAALRAGLRATCHTEHGMDGVEGWKLRVQKVAAARLTRAIVSVSTPLRQALSAQCLVPASQILRIDNGIPVERFATDAKIRDEVRDQLGIYETDFVIGCVARLQHLKGVDVLIDALRELGPVDRPVRVLIVGDGEDRAMLEARASCLPMPVTFAGARRDVDRCLQAMDLFALPSRSEGLPLAALEAMAAGVPIVATDVGELPHLLRDGAGVIVPRENAIQLAAALRAGIHESALRDAMKETARVRVLNEYSTHTMVDAYGKLYGSIIQRRA